MCEKGTRGGCVPYLRIARVHIAVTCPAASVAVDVRLSGPLVAVTGVVVRLDKGVKVAGGVSVLGGRGVAKRKVAVLVAGREVGVG